MKKVILFLNQDALSAYCWSERGALPLAFFPHNELGIADFREWILQHQGVSYGILTDLVDEDLQHELVPHLSGRDQQSLLQRKLEHYYRATPYRCAKIHMVGRQGGQDILQLSALTHREILDRILADLAVVKAPIFGVYSVALLTQEIIARLKPEHAHLMVMSCNSPGQLRQSYFTRHGLRFSRLGTFHTRNSMLTQAEMIAKEVIRARQYLSTLRLMTREEALHIWALFDSHLAELRSEILLAMGDEAEHVQFNIQSDMTDLAARLKLPKGCQSWHDVMVAMLVTYALPNQYAPTEALKYHQLNILGRGLSWAAIIILILALILSGLTWLQGLQLQAQFDMGAQRQVLVQQQLRRHLALLHDAGAHSPEQLQVSAQFYRDHIESAPQLDSTLRRLSMTLLDYPSLTIDEVQWQVGIVTNAPMDNAPTQIPSQGVVATPWLTQTIVLTGRMQNRLAYRAALAQIGQLEAALKQWPAAQVRVRQWPIDIRSESEIKPAAEQAVVKADFVIELQLPATSGRAL
ncbi:hypothetical protein NT239_07540 [Chitinibacter sp. SCUT-21]|uniref:hypothetical protein n=1 Tax=Chitinibacter sp. SCUT-21 TaxID=2970891 RepID=UPI0035A6FB60